MAPLIMGVAAGAVGFLLGALGNKKDEPAQQQPDPRIDDLMQNQERMEGMLGQVLQNQEQLMGGQQAIFGQNSANNFMNGFCQTPAVMNPFFCGCQNPLSFLGQLDSFSMSVSAHFS